jgi:hypothetical protein
VYTLIQTTNVGIGRAWRYQRGNKSRQAIILISSSLYSAYLLKVDVYVMFYIVVSNLSILIKHKVRSKQGRVCIPFFFSTINIFNEIFMGNKSSYTILTRYAW